MMKKKKIELYHKFSELPLSSSSALTPDFGCSQLARTTMIFAESVGVLAFVLAFVLVLNLMP
ncbi:hypothetical protein C5167_001551 [Papaver somniferum]|uniref:Uncharacterized protein n=1 Tax=Papaver somniferum TaxID=3469 RepID=A0A4Y7KVK3_PAPSO|nr:hypothetical protein C5167_001551 [Papaver somniferum]